MQKGEDLTKEELSFLYELDRPIATLDTYRKDPRITELKEKYGIEYALEKGIDVNKLVSNLNLDSIICNLDTLLRNGARIYINALVSNLRPNHIIYNLDTLLKHGADIDVNELVSNLDSYSIANNLDTLLRNGADINNVIKKMDKKDIEENIDLLREYGAKLDISQENN